VSDTRKKRVQVEKWINEQEVCPSRKQVAERFPDAPQRIVRALLQARKDRERMAS
jgi:hypothetical protein